MTLKDVACGQTVKVTKLTGEGPVKRRIMDMGITKGVEIYVRKVAPLGDPIEVTVRGYELSYINFNALSDTHIHDASFNRSFSGKFCNLYRLTTGNVFKCHLFFSFFHIIFTPAGFALNHNLVSHLFTNSHAGIFDINNQIAICLRNNRNGTANYKSPASPKSF